MSDEIKDDLDQEPQGELDSENEADSVSPVVNDNEELCWYVLHVYSGCEDRVINLLKKRIEDESMEREFGEIVVPKEEVISLRGPKKKKVKIERKFFPGYVLVQMEMTDETWHLVRQVPRVLGFIGGRSERPQSITNHEAEAILQRVKDGGEKPRHKVLFESGEVIRVTDGPFADFDGVVEDVNYEKSRLRVSVMIFGRATPVELAFTQVEKD